MPKFKAAYKEVKEHIEAAVLLCRMQKPQKRLPKSRKL